ncbi:hypothetical protein QMK38_19765 [Lysinibacillus fusiformis]|nr:hypothetical protein [Lysinibacillus fusiformis]
MFFKFNKFRLISFIFLAILVIITFSKPLFENDSNGTIVTNWFLVVVMVVAWIIMLIDNLMTKEE